MKESPEISRRRFLGLLPKAIVTALAAKYASDLISHPETLPKSSAEGQVIDPLNEPLSSKINTHISVTEQANSYQSGIKEKSSSENNELNESLELGRLRAIQALKKEISTPLNQINPEIATLYQRGFILDFSSLTEVKEATSNPDLEESIKKIIQLLSVEAKEVIEYKTAYLEFYNKPEVINLRKKIELINLIRFNLTDFQNEERIVDYKKYTQLWNNLFPGKTIPDAERLSVIESDLFFEISKLETNYLGSFEFDYEFVVKNWDNQSSCNLYASSFFACFGLQNKFSHRVDSRNNPVIYIKNETNGRTEFFIENESGQYTKPKGSVRELSAEGQHTWMIEDGEKYGWIDVTNLDYDEKLQKLKEGYVFYGSTEDHNWVIVGLTINGEFQPLLTQATSHVLLGAFKRKEDILAEDEPNPSRSNFYYRNSELYAAGYKFMPQLFGNDEARIFAIKPKN